MVSIHKLLLEIIMLRVNLYGPVLIGGEMLKLLEIQFIN